MRIRDLISETYSAISGNKARSGLTMLGIVIGISSVIVLVGVGQGATASVTSSISSLGTNLLVVSPGSTTTSGVRSSMGTATTLTEDNAEAIKEEAAFIANLDVELSGRYQITYKSNNTNSTVIGTDENYADVRSVTLESGSFISAQQVTNKSKVAILGSSVRDDLFGEDVDPTGKTIKINKVQFKVIGVAESEGGTGSTTDSAIFVPITAAQTFLAGSTSISSIAIEAIDADSVDLAKSEITEILLAQHNIVSEDEADFSITSQADLVDSLSSVTGTLTLLLGAIAGISLLVGGIGIMNMMLTTVTERTREIGLRKAVGAKRADISMQFLTEAVTLTFFGGAIGIILGWGIAWFITYLEVITTAVTIQSVALAFGVSALVGIIFGFYPANKAASLKPIDALKYE